METSNNARFGRVQVVLDSLTKAVLSKYPVETTPKLSTELGNRGLQGLANDQATDPNWHAESWKKVLKILISNLRSNISKLKLQNGMQKR
jgi:hypothetical protein